MAHSTYISKEIVCYRNIFAFVATVISKKSSPQL